MDKWEEMDKCKKKKIVNERKQISMEGIDKWEKINKY